MQVKYLADIWTFRFLFRFLTPNTIPLISVTSKITHNIALYDVTLCAIGFPELIDIWWHLTSLPLANYLSLTHSCHTHLSCTCHTHLSCIVSYLSHLLVVIQLLATYVSRTCHVLLTLSQTFHALDTRTCHVLIIKMLNTGDIFAILPKFSLWGAMAYAAWFRISSLCLTTCWWTAIYASQFSTHTQVIKISNNSSFTIRLDVLPFVSLNYTVTL